jgi:HTH-type transcriptional regulator/antitoxin HigA
MDCPDAVDAVCARLAELGLRQKDLAEIIGSQARASEVLGRKRALSVAMIRAIHLRLDVPLDVLLDIPAARARAIEDHQLSIDRLRSRARS